MLEHRCGLALTSYRGRQRVSAGLAAFLALITLGSGMAQEPAGGRSDARPRQGGWVAISDGVLTRLTEEGKKPSWPGQTAGVSVDRLNGDVRTIVPDQGLWKSSDHGAT